MMTMGGMQSALSVQAAGFHVRGDVNADGVVGIADAVVLQKWLLGIPNTTLQNWDAANLCKDAELDVSDFTCMKRMILNPQPSVEITSPYYNNIWSYKSMTSQPWFTRTCYLSYNESSDWTNVHHLGTTRPYMRQLSMLSL